MEGISLRLSSEKDEQSILSLFSSAYGKERRSDIWRWEYLDGSVEPIVVLAETQGKLVGHYGILRRNLRHSGSEIRAGLVVDVMTDPRYGRRGIFVQSAEYAFSKCRNAGLSILIGFPNDAAIRGHLKVRWRELGSIGILARPLRVESIFKRILPNERLVRYFAGALNGLLDITLQTGRIFRHKNSVFSVITASELLGHTEELVELINDSIPPHSVSTERTVQWLRWRLSDPVGQHMVIAARDKDTSRLEGISIIKVKEIEGFKTGEILDLLVRPGHRRLERAMLFESVKLAHSHDCEMCVILNNPAARRFLNCLSTLFVPTSINLRFIVRSTDGKQLPSDLLVLGNWYLDLIDHDVF